MPRSSLACLASSTVRLKLGKNFSFGRFWLFVYKSYLVFFEVNNLNMAVMSLFCRNISRLKTPAAAILGQTPARNVSAFLRLHNKASVLASASQQCSYSQTSSALISSPHIAFRPLVQHGQIRHFSQQPPPEQVEESFEEHEKTVYKGILATQIKLVKSFSLMTSLIGISCQPLLFLKMGENGGNIALMVASGAFLSFFTFATPLLIHWVSKKYVVELMYNKIDDSYTAITYSLLLRKKEVKLLFNILSI